METNNNWLKMMQGTSSRQDYATPWGFVKAVEKDFKIDFIWDLAASSSNAVTEKHFDKKTNSLIENWCDLPNDGAWWLNPPYDDIGSWVKKCKNTSKIINKLFNIFVLVPASVSTNWFADHVFDVADVYFVRPRITFVGAKHPYPRDLMLLRYWHEGGQLFSCYKWDQNKNLSLKI
jgi:phage N-6-adenine-methyltransferase